MVDFPNVPNVAGVPRLFRDPLAVATSVILLTADAVGLGSLFGNSEWGVFEGGSAIITADTVTSVDFKRNWSISDYPLERGAFESYNKVQTPYEVRVRFAAGGSEDNRAALLSSVAAIADDTNLYDVVTPEEVYTNVNVSHYDYHRTSSRGLGLLVVDVWLQEIRESGGFGDFLDTVDPWGQSPINGGSPEPVAATSSQLQSLPALT